MLGNTVQLSNVLGTADAMLDVEIQGILFFSGFSLKKKKERKVLGGTLRDHYNCIFPQQINQTNLQDQL